MRVELFETAAVVLSVVALAACEPGEVPAPDTGVPPADARGAFDAAPAPDAPAPMPDARATDAAPPLDAPAPPPDARPPSDAPAPPPDALAPCAPIPGASYSLLSISGSPTDRPAAVHGDINLLLRRWESVPGVPRALVMYSGPTDALAPHLNTLFTDDRVPGFPDVFHVQSWDWGCNCPGPYMTDPYPVQLIAMAMRADEVIEVPDSGYDIGGGNDALVLYAADNTITLKYTREDNVVHGYTIHLANICVEPSLLALYRSANAAGRAMLPAVRGNQPIGRVRGTQVLAAVRDTGAWMDPRSQKDWWPP